MQHRSFFSNEQITAIEDSIQRAELLTSGEIRVHIEGQCQANVLDRAAQVFAELHMHETSLRNGVLFYLAVNDHKFAVIGDAGINNVVPINFWDEIKIKMQARFRSGNFADGLIEGVEMAGKHLQSHFPRQADDKNELSDHVSFGQN